MKIGDEVFVHGYVDEIRKDTVIIRNDGGYFGTTGSEISPCTERKKGEWIPHPNKEFREWDVCTACGTGCKRREYGKNPNGTEYVTQYNYPFCPNCGAALI